MKVRDIIKRIEEDGWYLVGIRGDRRHYKHTKKKNIITIAGHSGKDIPIGTLLQVLKQAQIEK